MVARAKKKEEKKSQSDGIEHFQHVCLLVALGEAKQKNL